MSLWIIKLEGGLGHPPHNEPPMNHLTVGLKEGRVCQDPQAQPPIPRRDPPRPHWSSPFPQLVEHSVVPSCFQLWSRLRLGGCGAAGTRLSGRWEENPSGCLTGKVCADSEVNTWGAPPCTSSFSSAPSFSAPSSWLLPSDPSWPLKGSPRRDRCMQHGSKTGLDPETPRGQPSNIRNHVA